jgi:hypothetical protein
VEASLDSSLDQFIWKKRFMPAIVHTFMPAIVHTR